MKNFAAMSAAVQSRASNPSRSTKVLIVEDEAIVAADLQQTVNALGYDAYATAASSEEALYRAHQTAPDVVLMDIRLEGHVSGIESAMQLREECDAAIVFLTSHADDSTIERARKARPSGYLLKPVTATALKAAIGLAMDARNRDHWARVREMTLKLRGAELADVLDSLNSALLVETTELKLRHINQPFCSMFGLGDPLAHPQETDTEWLIQSIGAQCDDHTGYSTLVASLRRQRKPSSGDIIRLLDGRILERDYIPLFRGQMFRGHLWTYRDVTSRERERLALVDRADSQPNALIDESTGLHNHRGFNDLAQGFLRFLGRNQQKKILFYFELDGIKSINDRFGNGVGDQAIRDMAEALRECFRDSDLIARLGADKFVALACMPPTETHAVKLRILRCIQARNSERARVYQLATHVGIVEHVGGEKLEALLARAQEALSLDRHARRP